MTEPTPLQQLEDAVKTALDNHGAGYARKTAAFMIKELTEDERNTEFTLLDDTDLAAIITAAKAYALAIVGENESKPEPPRSGIITVEHDLAPLVRNELRSQLRHQIEEGNMT